MKLPRGRVRQLDLGSPHEYAHPAQVISEDLGLTLEKVDIGMMGRAKKVTISKDDTIILDGLGDKSAITERCDQIRESIEVSSSDYDR